MAQGTVIAKRVHLSLSGGEARELLRFLSENEAASCIESLRSIRSALESPRLELEEAEAASISE